ncbi:MAG: HEAT repeat domain-containing protein, partial [Acidobacteriaceae bacterium]|nr:HEAT repeat domain-containing protein [Acidobacteriaceae bacterium]
FSSRNDQVVDADVIIRPQVGQALGDLVKGGANMEVRANAARAAGILRDKTAVPSLIQGLHSRDDQTIVECLVALQKIRDLSAGPGVAFLTHDLDPRIQALALETIGVLRSLPSAPDVRTALKNAPIKVQRAALEALAMMGIPGDRATFQQYATDKDPELRAAALEGLGRIREPGDTPLLQQAYDEEGGDWRVHLAAAFALVDEGKVDTSEFSPLTYLLENLNTKGRANVATAYLVELTRRADVRNAIAKLVPESTKDQKLALCSILASTQEPDVIPLLNTLSRDIDPDVSFAASKALRIVQAGRS